MKTSRPYGVTVVSIRTILSTKCCLQGRDLIWKWSFFSLLFLRNDIIYAVLNVYFGSDTKRAVYPIYGHLLQMQMLLTGRMLLFTRKVIEVLGGQNKEMRKAKACSKNIDHYVLKI